MLITKLHLESHLHPLIYIIQIQPLVQRTTYFRNSTKNTITKSMDDGKEVYADFAYNAKQTEKGWH
jgi:hypothetical protein